MVLRVPTPMSKMPAKFENPVDNLFVGLASAMEPFLKSTGHTPNVLTTYSAVSGALALTALWHDKIGTFTGLWALRVFWDDADGHFARRYDMATDFGDAYDHLNDIVSMLALLVVVHKKYVVPPLVMALFVGMFVISIVHLGCQQSHEGKYTGPGSSNAHGMSLDVLRPLCPGQWSMAWTRWVSHGGMHVFIVAAVWYMHAKCPRKPRA